MHCTDQNDVFLKYFYPPDLLNGLQIQLLPPSYNVAFEPDLIFHRHTSAAV